VILCLAFVVSGCGDQDEPEAKPVRPVPFFGVEAVGSGEFRRFPGKVAADVSLQVSFDDPGQIVELPISDGMMLEKGALIARLDDREIQTRVASAEATLRNAQADFERVERLFKQGVLAEMDLDRARKELEVATADRDAAAKGASDTAVYAPFTGVVSTKIAKQFQNVQAKEVIAIFDDLSSLEIGIDIPEQDMLRLGDRMSPEALNASIEANLEIPSLEGATYPLAVKNFTTAADPNTQTFRVKFRLARQEGAGILPGMSAVVLVRPKETANPPANILVPVSAVRVEPDGTPSVWVIAPDNTVRRQPVTVGDMQGKFIEITGGLEPGTTIAAAGVNTLTEGTPVRELEK